MRVWPSARTVGGILAFVGGLGVIILVSIGLLRPVRRWRRLVALPVAVALLGFAGYPVATAIHATTQPNARLGDTTPADHGLDYEDVRFATADGVMLSGWYLPPAGGAAVVLLHGASSTRSGVLDHAVVLHGAGYGVLLFDARGHGRSDGDPMDLGWYGDLDTGAAVDHLVSRAEVDPTRIGVVGLSMGGEEAIGAAAADPRLRAVVAEGAQNRTYADRDDWLPRNVNGWLQRAMDRVAFTLTELLTPADVPISLRDVAGRIAPRPVLLIAGNGEVEAARSIQEAAPDSVEIWETHTGHTRGLSTHPEEWTARVGTFLDTALGPD